MLSSLGFLDTALSLSSYMASHSSVSSEIYWKDFSFLPLNGLVVFLYLELERRWWRTSKEEKIYYTHETLNIRMMSNLCKLSYIVNTILIEIPEEWFSLECAKLALKLCGRVKMNSKGKNKVKEVPTKTLRLTTKLYKIRKFATSTGVDKLIEKPLIVLSKYIHI